MKILLTAISNPKSPFGKDNGSIVQGFGLAVPTKVYYDSDSIMSHDDQFLSPDVLVEVRRQKAA
ncbi:MAG: hypothetical protein LRZ85_00450 [Alphaproteobacteria bacterium]|nr:hypothetical protein [Alphaproteobacteria bacterium]MCD8526075.1 hypothetical protein [Alphaproteobacteria bacterium]MCD8570961.1 hypothetical protein [Alphaproteobacteria bacterium]